TNGAKVQGAKHGEDSNCIGCILGDAERCRRRRSAAQGAAASGASGWQGSDWQVSGWQGSDWEISAARRYQGLTACVLERSVLSVSGYASHFHDFRPASAGRFFFCAMKPYQAVAVEPFMFSGRGPRVGQSDERMAEDWRGDLGSLAHSVSNLFHSH